MRTQLLQFMRRFAGDEVGAVMTEYIIMMTYLVLGVMWLNRVTDTILFGQSPYILPNNSEARAEALTPPDALFQGYGPQGDEFEGEQDLLVKIGGNSPAVEAARPDRAYLSQVYIHLSRP